MENKTIDIEPRAAVEMQTWENIYDRVPSQYKQEVLQLDMGIIRVKPLYNNQTNTMRTCTLAVTAMGKTTHIYMSQDANPFS